MYLSGTKFYDSTIFKHGDEDFEAKIKRANSLIEIFNWSHLPSYQVAQFVISQWLRENGNFDSESDEFRKSLEEHIAGIKYAHDPTH